MHQFKTSLPLVLVKPKVKGGLNREGKHYPRLLKPEDFRVPHVMACGSIYLLYKPIGVTLPTDSLPPQAFAEPRCL